MKKFFTMFLFVAALTAAFSFVLAQDTGEGEKKFVLHGEVRQRADYNNNLTDFSSDNVFGESDDFLMFPWRARIAAEGHFTKDVVGYVEFNNFGVWGDTPPIKGNQPGPVGGNNTAVNPPFPTNTNILQNTASDTGNSIEVYQAYIGLNNIAGSKFSLTLGRQEIVKGSEMLLGDNDFYSGISHDAMLGCWHEKSFDLDVWWSRPLQRFNPFTGGIVPDHESINFYGAWLDWNRYKNGIAWAAYILDYEDGINGNTVALPDPSRRQFYTVGARTDKDSTGKKGLYWNAEYAMQKGNFNNGPTLSDTGDIEASAYEVTVGWNFGGNKKDRKVHILYDSASGDNNATDDKAKSFDPLFQDSHDRYGLTDIFTFSDLTVWGAGYSADFGNKMSWGVDYFDQSTAEDIQGTGTQADGKKALGHEIDGWWKMQYTPNTQFLAGLAWFDPGDAIKGFNNTNGFSTDSGMRFVTQARLRW